MARKKLQSEESSESGTYSVVIEPDLVPRVKLAAAALGMSAPNYINSRLVQILDKDIEQALEGHGYTRKTK
jgi:hypothetical protein